jgi:hypothetical protein
MPMPMGFHEWIVFLGPWGHFNGLLGERLSRIRAAAEHFPDTYCHLLKSHVDCDTDLEFLDSVAVLRRVGRRLARMLERGWANS